MDGIGSDKIVKSDLVVAPPPAVEDLLQIDDIVESIFSHLPAEDLPSVSCVDKSWKEITVLTGKRQVRDFVEGLLARAGDPAVFNALKGKDRVWEAETLCDVRTAAQSLKLELGQKLKTLSAADLDKIEKGPLQPRLLHLFGDLLALLREYQHTDHWLAKPDNDEKSQALYCASLDLWKLGDRARAREIAKIVPGLNNRSNVLKEFSKRLLDEGDLDGAREMADAIPLGKIQDIARIPIWAKLCESGDLDGAHEVAHTIRHSYTKSFQLYLIAIKRVKKGDLDGARKMVPTISEPREKSELINVILAKLAEAGDVSAMKEEIEPMARYHESPAHTLEVLCHFLLEADQSEKAHDLALTIPDEVKRSEVLKTIDEHRA